MMEKGSLIGFDGASGNHGCCDYCIGRVVGLDDQYATVEITEAMSCTSCWQVGHDQGHVFATIGSVEDWQLSDIRYIGDDDAAEFSTDVQWQFVPSAWESRREG